MSSFASWLARFRATVSRSSRDPKARPAPRRKSFLPRVEELETRTTPSFGFDLLASFGSTTLSGANPAGGLIQVGGDFYGTTANGGANGLGSVYKLTPNASGGGYTSETLYSFGTATSDTGSDPSGSLVEGADGNLYGTTTGGTTGNGTAFELTISGTFTQLYAFSGGTTDGAHPNGGLVEDASGNFFGTTQGGGANGFGTVFELSPPATSGNPYTSTILVSFSGTAGTNPGANPMDGLVTDGSGNLFGTTSAGDANNDGNVFEVTTSGTGFTTLHTFAGTDGANPNAALTRDSSGNLFGTTVNGGTTSSGTASGTVFEISSGGTFGSLYTFTGGTDGANPYGSVVEDGSGNLFGTTKNAGSGSGTVFEVPAGGGSVSTLYTFTGGTDGANPIAGLFKDSNGNLFGTAAAGGDASGDGTAFEVGIPSKVTATGGTGQNGIANSTLAPLVVQVTDSNGNPLSGVTVNWTTTGGSTVDSNFGGIPGNTTETTTTNSAGFASVSDATLGSDGPTTDPYTFSAAVTGVTTPATFVATTDTATSISVVSGNTQTGTVGVALAPLVAQVTDSSGKPVSGVTVTWALGTGTGSNISPTTSITNSSGLATAVATLGPTTGAYTFTASITTSTGTPSITYNETATNSAGAMISGVAYFGTGSRTASSQVVTGTTIELTGTTTNGIPVSETTTTDAGGFYSFLNLEPGTYQLSASNLAGNTLGSITLGNDQVLNQDLAFTGIANTGISLRLLLASGGLPYGNVANSQPFVLNPIQNMSVTTGTSPTVINLAGNFGEADMTDPIVQFSTSQGTVDVELFGKIAPQTVANFISYVESGSYTSSIIHRLQTTSSSTGNLQIDQGGGFTLVPSDPSNPQTSPISSLKAITTDPPVQGEFGISNTPGTIAMALSGSPSNPNSGTSEFFFNTGDNSRTLDPQSFTVFGKVLTPADQAVISKINAVPNYNVNGNTTGNFTSIPLTGYTGPSVPNTPKGAPIADPNFPTDTTAANYVEVNGVSIISPNPVSLMYTVSSSNTSVVNPTLGGVVGNDNNLLTLNYGSAGTAVITVTATNPVTGLTVTTSFTVTVS